MTSIDTNYSNTVPVEEMKDWMGLALQKARDSLLNAEVPVGCLFIYENEVIASGNNTVNETRNATRHAEINCIDKVLDYCKEHQLDYHDVFKKIDVVVTVEPCIMCAAALHQLHIRSIVYGCPNDRFGGCTSVFEVPKISDAVIDITSNVRAEEAMILLKNFYKGTNPNAPECKVKKKKPFNILQFTDENKDADKQNEDAENKSEESDDKQSEVDRDNEEVALKNKQNTEQNEAESSQSSQEEEAESSQEEKSESLQRIAKEDSSKELIEEKVKTKEEEQSTESKS